MISLAHEVHPVGISTGETHLCVYNGAPDDGGIPPRPVCDIAHLGQMECEGTGFITCDYSGWVYRACGPGTKCHPGNPLFCGW